MRNTRLTMRKIREILRLKHEQNLSNREIAQSVGISPSTVSQYVTRAKYIDLTWPLPNDLDEETLYKRLFPPPPLSPEIEREMPDVAQIHQELKRHKGVSLQLLWHEYREHYPNGYGYSQFCLYYRNFVSTLNPTMRLTHRAGENFFVDYAGVTVPWIDKLTGEIHQAEIFVGVLGASSYTFVEATDSQSLRDWIGSHQRAFEFFGGVTQAVVPDNLKSGVSKAHIYDPDTNPTYQDMAIYYGVAILPARARKPRDKAKAEVAVQIVERWILARLRHQSFFTLAALNLAIKELLVDLNNRDFKKLPGTRKSQFDMIDKPALKPLPTSAYQYVEIKAARVHIDYHIEYDKHYYSVPHHLVKEQVEVQTSSTLISVYAYGQRVSSHPRS